MQGGRRGASRLQLVGPRGGRRGRGGGGENEQEERDSAKAGIHRTAFRMNLHQVLVRKPKIRVVRSIDHLH